MRQPSAFAAHARLLDSSMMMTRMLGLAVMFASSLAAQPLAPDVTKALDYLRDNHERHLDKQVQIAEVAAPTFHEGRRAQLMADEFRRVGLTHVEIDKQGNVLGWRPGSSEDALVIAAHLDISFEPGVNTKVRKEGARWYGPGLADENKQRAASKTEVTAKTELIGNRPAGVTSPDDSLVVAAMAASGTLGRTPRFSIGSTDANLPMSLGIPAITLSGGGRSDNAHSLEEWFEPADAWQGPQTVLLTILNYDKVP